MLSSVLLSVRDKPQKQKSFKEKIKVQTKGNIWKGNLDMLVCNLNLKKKKILITLATKGIKLTSQ